MARLEPNDIVERIVRGGVAAQGEVLFAEDQFFEYAVESRA